MTGRSSTMIKQRLLFAACLAMAIGAFVLFVTPGLLARSLTSDPNAVLPLEELTVETGSGKFNFTAEIADEPHERSQGLMFRETMVPTHGMLFDFGISNTVIMWMENTPLPLDMVFIRKNGTVAHIAPHTVPFSRDHIPSGGPVTFVLELNAGIAGQIGLKAGDIVRHPFFGNAE